VYARDCANCREPASPGEGAWGSPRVPAAGVCQARACARGCVRGRGGAPGRAAATAAAAAAALGLGGHRPPAPASRPRPASSLSLRRASARFGAQRRRLPEPERSQPGRPEARTACGRAGDAGPPRARPSPGPGPRGKGLSRPPPPGWRASPRSPSACSCGCSCRRCPAPGRRAPQVSAPARSPLFPGAPDPHRTVLGGESCAGSLGAQLRVARARIPAAGSRRSGASVLGPSRPPAARVSPSSSRYFPAGPPGWSNFPRLLRVFPLAASHLSESVT
jgi:hypothetical protein